MKRKLKYYSLKLKRWILTHNKLFLLIALLPFIAAVSFVKILDRTVKHRNRPIEFLIVHYTANLNPGADARANAYYLRKKERAGTHYCIDDEEIVQCTEEHNVAYAVGDRKWLGFIPKPWLENKIKNNNSLSFEMCLGGDRNDSLILDMTAQQLGWQLVNKGLDISHVVRHHDVTGKHCPRFFYNDEKWDQRKEDIAWFKFKVKVMEYQNYHLEQKRLRKANDLLTK